MPTLGEEETMAMLHDDNWRSQTITRIQSLRRDSARRWGRMSVDQMLWHVNAPLASALGQMNVPAQKPPLPRPLMRWMVLNLPWPRGAPTLPVFVATGSYDFESERTRCLKLIDQFAAKPVQETWPTHPVLGQISGRDLSRLQAKHLDHHLKQVGV
jgi:hypothetical protein